MIGQVGDTVVACEWKLSAVRAKLAARGERRSNFGQPRPHGIGPTGSADSRRTTLGFRTAPARPCCVHPPHPYWRSVGSMPRLARASARCELTAPAPAFAFGRIHAASRNSASLRGSRPTHTSHAKALFAMMGSARARRRASRSSWGATADPFSARTAEVDEETSKLRPCAIAESTAGSGRF